MTNKRIKTDVCFNLKGIFFWRLRFFSKALMALNSLSGSVRPAHPIKSLHNSRSFSSSPLTSHPPRGFQLSRVRPAWTATNQEEGGCRLTPLPPFPPASLPHPTSPQFLFSLHLLISLFPPLRGMGREMQEWQPADTRVGSCQSSTLCIGRATVAGRKGRSGMEGEWRRTRRRGG